MTPEDAEQKRVDLMVIRDFRADLFANRSLTFADPDFRSNFPLARRAEATLEMRFRRNAGIV